MQTRDDMQGLKKILVVDDSEIDRMVLKGILENEFDVYEVDNGYAALDMLIMQKKPLDAIFLDISMPILDGLDVLSIMRKHKLDNIPIFMITSEATKDNIEKAIQYHIEDFIRKPFDREFILQRIRARLNVEPQYTCSDEDMEMIKKYIADLEGIYN